MLQPPPTLTTSNMDHRIPKTLNIATVQQKSSDLTYQIIRLENTPPNRSSNFPNDSWMRIIENSRLCYLFSRSWFFSFILFFSVTFSHLFGSQSISSAKPTQTVTGFISLMAGNIQKIYIVRNFSSWISVKQLEEHVVLW